MKNLKVAVIYYSSTGTNYQLAQWAEAAAKKEGTNEVRLRKVKELAPEEAINANKDWKKHVEETKGVQEVSLDDLEWADVFVFSAPTRYGNLPAQLKQFLDTTGGLWFNGKLANKVVTAMTSASNPHGGQEATLLALYTTMFHWGAIVAAPGYTDQAFFESGGNPYGLSVTAGKDELDEKVRTGVARQVDRALKIASWVSSGKNDTQ